MEQFTRVKEHAAAPRSPCASPKTNRKAAGRAPLYASPWIALFILLRSEYRQFRMLES